MENKKNWGEKEEEESYTRDKGAQLMSFWTTNSSDSSSFRILRMFSFSITKPLSKFCPISSGKSPPGEKEKKNRIEISDFEAKYDK